MKNWQWEKRVAKNGRWRGEKSSSCAICNRVISVRALMPRDGANGVTFMRDVIIGNERAMGNNHRDQALPARYGPSDLRRAAIQA